MITTKISQKEIITNLNAQLFQVGSTKLVKRSDFEQILDQLPTGMQINSFDGKCRFMNHYTRDFIGITLEELNMAGTKYRTLDIFQPHEIESLRKTVNTFHQQNNLHEKLSFFQQLKPRGKKHFEWVYICSKLIETPGEEYNDRLLITCPVSEMGEASRQVHKVLDENLYFKKYFKKFALLTLREKEIIPLVALGLTNVEIAEKLFISKDTVSQHRKNINRKLEFKTYYELIKFAEAFELL